MCCGLHLVLCLVVSVDLQGPGTDSERKHCQGKGRLAIRGEIVFHTRDILSISLISMLLLDSFLLCLINIVYLLFDLQVFCVCVLLSCSGTQILFFSYLYRMPTESSYHKSYSCCYIYVM